MRAFTRSAATGRLALYVDGSLAGEASGPTQSLTGPASIDFGRIQSGNNYFAGKLDDVAVYGTALGPGDVAAHYASALRHESWTNGETRSYKFELQLDNSTTIEGLGASATFHWEAQGT